MKVRRPEQLLFFRFGNYPAKKKKKKKPPQSRVVCAFGRQP